MSDIPNPPPCPKEHIHKAEGPAPPTLTQKVMAGASTVTAPVGAAAGAAAHALAEQSHRSLEKVEQSVAVTESAPASLRMSAAKAAIQHHNEVLRHEELKKEDLQASGLPAASEKITTAASSIPSTVSSAAKTTGETVSSAMKGTGETVSNAAMATSASVSYAAHGIAEKSHRGIETAEQAAAVSSVVPSNVRFAAASSALEHHAAAEKHAAAKSESYEASGLETLGAAIKSGYNTVVNSAASAYHSLVGSGTTAGTETRENPTA